MLKAWFSLNSLCACVAQIPPRTFATKSCNVRLFKTKDDLGAFAATGFGTVVRVSVVPGAVRALSTMTRSESSSMATAPSSPFRAELELTAGLGIPAIADAFPVFADDKLTECHQVQSHWISPLPQRKRARIDSCRKRNYSLLSRSCFVFLKLRLLKDDPSDRQ